MSSGQVTLSTQSVDYGGGRGTRSITNVINWNVDANGNISFSQASVSGNTWWICGTASWYGVHLVPQVSYDGTNWVNLADEFQSVEICPGSTDTKAMSTTLIGRLGSYHLNGDCNLRFLYYANAAPAPTPDLPNAFPDSGYSAAVQVPVHVEVSYRPGERKVSGTWMSHNRSGGACERKVNGSWVEMTTNNGGVGTDNPPSRKQSGTWYNMRKVGN